MSLSSRFKLAALAAASMTLAACGGGGGNFLAGGGVSGTGITSGSVTGFGSVIVNQSIHGTTAATEFERNGLPSTQGDFRVGDVVVIEWDSDDDGVTREAIRVTYQRELFGEVTANPDEANGTVGVLGQTVRADATTIFDEFAPAPPGAIFPPDLVQGACVEVTGFRDASGNLFATRIELEPSCSTVEIQGVVSSVVGNIIQVSGTTVDISGVATTPVVNDVVDVEGTFNNISGVLTATALVVLDDDLSRFEDDDIDVEGIIDNCSIGCGADSDVTFSVSGIPVSTNSQTTYENGDFTQLRDDIRVEVEGTFSSGELVADKVEFKLDGSIRLETIVFLADPATGDVTVDYGAETLLVLTDPLITQFRDKTDTIVPPFGVDDLDSGDYVKIAAFLDGTDIVASKLELEELAGPTVDEDRVLEGPITDLSGRPSSIEILGVTISTASLSTCEDETGGSIDCGLLVSGLTPNDIVQAQGEDVGGVIIWDELELEN
jgi:hypothetical protein